MRLSRLILFLPLLAGIGAAVIFAQGDDVATKRRDLDRLRERISESEGRLGRLEGEARRSAAAIREVRMQAAALDTLLDVLLMRERELASEMIEARNRRDSLDGRLSEMKREFARMARALFRNRLLTTSSSMLLLPKEHQKLALRQHLFQHYARAQRRRGEQIVGMAVSLAGEDSLLRQRQQEQIEIIELKRREMERLYMLQRDEAAALDRTAVESRQLRAMLERQNGEASQIAAMISRLSERDRASEARRRQSRVAEEGGDPKKKRAKEGSGKEKSTRRPLRFIWPTSGRKIVEGYGERTNPRTGTVTINPGINIAATTGSTVVASEDGTVSLVSWLPSYGTIVIVEHRDGYRTVYGSLAAATVSRGARVRAGGKIGTAGGGMVHFEVWKGQERMDPGGMLK